MFLVVDRFWSDVSCSGGFEMVGCYSAIPFSRVLFQLVFCAFSVDGGFGIVYYFFVQSFWRGYFPARLSASADSATAVRDPVEIHPSSTTSAFARLLGKRGESAARAERLPLSTQVHLQMLQSCKSYQGSYQRAPLPETLELMTNLTSFPQAYFLQCPNLDKKGADRGHVAVL